MKSEKEIWFAEAKHKLTLLIEFEDHLLVPDARTLNACLFKGSLILKKIYEDNPDMLSESLKRYEEIKINKEISTEIEEFDLVSLNESYLKGLTPNQAAIQIIKWCDTPEEASSLIVSPQQYNFPIIMLIGGILTFVIVAIIN